MTNRKVDFSKFDLESYVGEYAKRDNKKSRDGNAWFNCCFHEENTASLHVTKKQVFHCHGCGVSGGSLDFVKHANKTSTKAAFDIIKKRSGIETVISEYVEEPTKFFEPKEFEKYYEYNGGFVRKYRMKNKSFLWCNYSNDDWWNGVGNFNVDLYAPNGVTGNVIIAEGEKDADTLCSMGFNGASSPNGTYKWKDEYTQQLKNAERVVILNDNDFNGIAGSQLCQHNLKESGINTKRVSPIEVEYSEEKGYDITNVVEIIGLSETKIRLQTIIDDQSMWGVLWNEENNVMEETKVEVVWESGLGEEYDSLIRKAVQETINDGDIGELTTSELSKVGKKNGIGMRQIRKRVADQAKLETINENTYFEESAIIEIENIGKYDIEGSNYSIQNGTNAIVDFSGTEVIGHFLGFIGIVEDAEMEQDTNVKLCLAYNTPQNPHSIKTLIVPKRQLSTSLDLIKLLSGYNINVTQVNGVQVVQYLQDLQNHFHENTHKMKSLSRFGWFEDKLMPYEQSEAGIVFDSTVAQPVANKLDTTIGDKELSRSLIQEIANYSESSAIILGTSVASLVLSFMNEGGNQSFALNVWNETSTGKSVTCQGVASLFGYPYKDKGWWGDGNATMNKDIYHNSLLGNLPTFIDDPARNRGYSSEQKRDYIFSVTSGQGRGRMQRTGDVAKDVREWCNIMIMTNETVFIDASIEDGGARARCLEICFDKPLNQDTVERWIDIMGDNYGHFAIDIANEIRSIGRVEFEKRIKTYIRWFNTNGVDGKRAINASMIMLGLGVVKTALGIDAIAPHDWLVKQIRGSGSLSDGQRAYIKLMKRVEVSDNAYRSLFNKDGLFIGSFGYSTDGVKVLNLPYKTLDMYGKEEGFNADSLINWGYAKGKMVSVYDSNNKPTAIVISNNRSTMRVIQLIYEWEGMQQDIDVAEEKYISGESEETNYVKN